MATIRTAESALLEPAERRLGLVERAAGPDERAAVRLEILEAAASRVGGFDLVGYRSLGSRPSQSTPAEALRLADGLLVDIARTKIHPALVLSALARPSLDHGERRATGAYHTDFRLAQHLAAYLDGRRGPGALTVDPAAGTGILLVAAALHVCGDDDVARGVFLSEAVCAADLSLDALRGTALALSALTRKLGDVERMLPRLRPMDSLLQGLGVWADVAPAGFGRVIANPPWEKLKLNRHEFVALGDGGGHYGGDVALTRGMTEAMGQRRSELSDYAGQVTEGLNHQGSGESDLYKAFLELSLRVAAPAGEVALLLPAGLIRSQGTKALRRYLWDRVADLDLTVLDNRARFFAIDTRFKFLAVHGTVRADAATTPVVLRHGQGDADGVSVGEATVFDRADLAAMRPDLSVPEVRSPRDLAVFRRISEARTLGDPRSIWEPRVVREVDMTRERPLFSGSPGTDSLAVVEGRMVHQYHFGAKAYRSGTGRKAIWEPAPRGAPLAPQFWIDRAALSRSVRGRVEGPRVGFCDVTGQTNERSLLASHIPDGVVCGNKVPTVTFGTAVGPEDQERAGQLWLALANSFTVDWYLRRTLTTTLNFFILLGLPFVELDHSSGAGARLVNLSRAVSDAGPAEDTWALAERRAEIDAVVATAYGLDPVDMALVLSDFPLLDRGQPPIPGERVSTVTRDLVLLRISKLQGAGSSALVGRVAAAREVGAVPYVPAEYVGGSVARKPKSTDCYV